MTPQTAAQHRYPFGYIATFDLGPAAIERSLRTEELKTPLGRDRNELVCPVDREAVIAVIIATRWATLPDHTARHAPDFSMLAGGGRESVRRNAWAAWAKPIAHAVNGQCGADAMSGVDRDEPSRFVIFDALIVMFLLDAVPGQCDDAETADAAAAGRNLLGLGVFR